MVRDSTSGVLVCSSCGIVQGYDNLEAHTGGINGPEGTLINLGSAGSGSVLSYKEKKIFNAQKVIDDLMLKLGFSADRSREVKTMIKTITEGEFGEGNWFPILVGASAYVVMRKENRSLPIAEVASMIGCDIHELGRMVCRVVEFLNLKLPEFDIVKLFERCMRTCPSFSEVSGHIVERMLKQGVFLVQCAVKWFLTTGRRPTPMVAAVLVFVAKLNEIDVQIETLAKEVHAAVSTSKLRYKELIDALVKVGHALPWGEDINAKNIIKNAPFIIQYMEMKLRSKPDGEQKIIEDVGFDLGNLVGECLSKELECELDGYGREEESHYFELEDKCGSNGNNSENLQISHECLSMMYTKFLNEFSNGQFSGENHRRGGRTRIGYGLDVYKDWWSGKSELSKKLFLKEILKKDVGLSALPPSFVNGCLANERRREKINAAKLRIGRIMNPSKPIWENNNDICSLESIRGKRKQKRKRVHDFDWEDLVVETLLLHNVKEEEIEKGHYNTLLELYVFNSGICKSLEVL